MRKAILISFMLLILLTACSVQTETSSTLPDHITMLTENKWPENEYTNGLPIPSGVVEWVMIDTQSNMCSISIAELTETQYQTFMQDISDIGFSILHSVSEEINGENYTSQNTLLTNGEKNLSIAYGDQHLSLAISFSGN